VNASGEHLSQDLHFTVAKHSDRSQFLPLEEALSVNLKKDAQGGSPWLFDGPFSTG